MIKKIHFIFLIVILISSCSLTNKKDSMDRCIAALNPIEFPIEEVPAAWTPRDIPPQPQWQYQATAPEFISYGSPIALGKNNTLWMISFISGKVLSYKTDTKEWKEYSKIAEYDAIPSMLFATRDGNIYGYGLYPQTSYLNSDNPLLSRYNEKTDSFEFIVDEENSISRQNLSTTTSPIIEDQSGKIWMVFYDGIRSILYMYDPITNVAERQLQMTQRGDVRFSVAPDGVVWIIDREANKIIKYFPATHETTDFSIEGLDDIRNQGNDLVFDKEGRLWILNRYYIDFSDPAMPILNKIIESPVFIDDGSGYKKYVYSSGQLSLESSNGWLWFVAGSGLVRLDMTKGEWCLFTTGRAPVVEDENHILWTFYSNQLYNYPLVP
jgi:hypothetical protein